MIIKKPVITTTINEITIQFPIESSRGKEFLWYRIDKNYQDFISDQCDAAVVALLIPAMEMDENIYIEGAISERLYRHLTDPCQKLLKEIMPFLNSIRIETKDFSHLNHNANGICAGFSAGIDSFCLLNDYYYKDIPNGLKLTHLVYNNVGSHFERGELLFEKRYLRIVPLIEHIQLPLIKINSNLDSFYKDSKDRNLGYGQTHTLRNASIPFLLQNGIKCFYYASGYSYNLLFVGETTEIAHINPIILSQLSSESLDLISVGGEYTRVQKTMIVANIPESYKNLDVCLAPRQDGSNCSKCIKCMKTQFTLEITGNLSLYNNVFKIKTYKKNRNRYIAEIIRQTRFNLLKSTSTDPFITEIDEYCKYTNYKYPIISYIIAFLKFIHSPDFLIDLVEKINKLSIQIMNRLTRQFH